MINVEERTKHCALVMAVLTGEVPDVDLIWASQAAEGYRRCFGQGRQCQEDSCLWHSQCLSLDSYVDAHLPGTYRIPQTSYKRIDQEGVLQTSPNNLPGGMH